MIDFFIDDWKLKYVRTKASPQQQLHKVHSVTGWEPTTCSVVENAM